MSLLQASGYLRHPDFLPKEAARVKQCGNLGSHNDQQAFKVPLWEKTRGP